MIMRVFDSGMPGSDQYWVATKYLQVDALIDMPVIMSKVQVDEMVLWSDTEVLVFQRQYLKNVTSAVLAGEVRI